MYSQFHFDDEEHPNDVPLELEGLLAAFRLHIYTSFVLESCTEIHHHEPVTQNI